MPRRAAVFQIEWSSCWLNSFQSKKSGYSLLHTFEELLPFFFSSLSTSFLPWNLSWSSCLWECARRCFWIYSFFEEDSWWIVSFPWVDFEVLSKVKSTFAGNIAFFYEFEKRWFIHIVLVGELVGGHQVANNSTTPDIPRKLDCTEDTFGGRIKESASKVLITAESLVFEVDRESKIYEFYLNFIKILLCDGVDNDDVF